MYLTKLQRIERDASMKVENIPIDRIRDNPFQPRKKYPREGIKRLAISITKQGLLNPISLVKIDDHYVIVGGHRRLRAFQYLKRKEVPAIIRRQSTEADLALNLAIENAMRQDFAPAEKANAIFNVVNARIPNVKNDIFRAMMLFNQIKLMKRRGSAGSDFIGKYEFEDKDIVICNQLLIMMDLSVNTAITFLRMLDLPADIQRKIISADNGFEEDLTKKGYISVRMAYEITRVKDQRLRRVLYKKIVKEGITYVNMKFVIDKLLEEGTTGFSKMGTSRKRDDVDYKLRWLTAKNFEHASLVWNWRAHKLPLASRSLDETCFVASLERLKKSSMFLVDATNKILEQTDDRKKIELVNKNLTVTVRPGCGGQKFRFGFPGKYGEDLGLNTGDEIELKIVAIRRRGRI